MLYSMVKLLVCAQTEADLAYHYEVFRSSPLVGRYPNFKNHVTDMFEKKRQDWCSAYRHGTYSNVDQPQNYGETSMRILKDHIFQRTRTFTLMQMLDFLTERFCAYYERRLLDYIRGGQQRAPSKFPPYANQRIVQITEDVFEVSGDDNDGCVYCINIATAMCTCNDATLGKLCKHIHYVFTHLTFLEPPSTGDQDDNKNELMYLVAVGSPSPENETAETAAAGIAIRGVNIEQQIAEFNEVVRVKFETVARQNPQLFAGAYKSCVGALKKLNSVQAAVNALKNFGKETRGGLGAGVKRRKVV
jgi:hypothetical protein